MLVLKETFEDNNFIYIDDYTYEIPNDYTSISGHLDLSSYDNLTIIIPDSIHYFDFMCLTCVANTPSINANRCHEIIFKHQSFENVNFKLCCFDGISNFKFISQDCINDFPKHISSYPYSISLMSNQNLLFDLSNYLQEKKNNINETLNIITMCLQNNENINSIKLLKLKIKKYDKIKEKLNDILNLLN